MASNTNPAFHAPTSASAATTTTMTTYRRIAAIYGSTAVLLGAFGAHGLKRHITDASRLANWSTAAQYQLIHSVVVLVLSGLHTSSKKSSFLVALFTAGMTLFSGSIYLLVLSPAKFRWLGPVTPLGGLCFVAGWAGLLW